MKKFYQQVYFPELPDEYEANIAEIEVPEYVGYDVFDIIDEIKEALDGAEYDDWHSQAEAIYTAAMERVGGSWRWLELDGGALEIE